MSNKIYMDFTFENPYNKTIEESCKAIKESCESDELTMKTMYDTVHILIC